MFAVVARRCYGCESWGRMDRQVPSKQREEGIHLQWIPDADLTPEDDDFFEQIMENPSEDVKGLE